MQSSIIIKPFKCAQEYGLKNNKAKFLRVGLTQFVGCVECIAIFFNTLPY
jgi:hypothetical protein